MLEALGPRQFFPQDTYNNSYRYSLNMAADYPTTIPTNNHDAGRRDDGIGPSRHSIVGASGPIDPQLPCHVGILSQYLRAGVASPGSSVWSSSGKPEAILPIVHPAKQWKR